jgi:lipoprotein-anchoring transpeptidase ErfK/SrfK
MPGMKRRDRRMLPIILITATLFVNAAFVKTTVFADNCLAAVNAPGCMYGLPIEQYQALLAHMAANPVPNVRPVPVDKENTLRYSNTKSKPARMASTFAGALFDVTPALPMAWVLRLTRPRVLPLWEADHTQNYVSRYTLVYLYASLKADGTTWYLIGPGQWVARTGLAQLIPASRPGGVGGKWIAVDVIQQVLTAYEDDRLVLATLISSGKGKYYTRLGLFNIYLRRLTDDMSSMMGAADAYNIYDVPFVMYFDNGEALHGSSWHDDYGTPMSHGCVNMTISDAHWLYDWTEDTPQAAVLVWRSR